MLNGGKYILDIGSSKLSLIATTRVAGETRILCKEDLLYDGYMDGEFLSEDKLTANLSVLLESMSRKMRKSISSVLVGVPSEFCICVCKRISRKFVNLHKITEYDISALIANNSKFGDSEEYEIINCSPMQYMLDDNVKTMSPVGKRTSSLVMDVSFILAKKSLTQLIAGKFAELGVTHVDFLSATLGQAMLCSTLADTRKPIAVVDVGHISTSVCVYKGEGLALLSSFSLGGGHISSDIMQVLGMNFKDAELIKRKIILTIEPDRNDYYEICHKGNLIKAPIKIANQVVKSRIEIIARTIAEVLSIDEVFKDIDLYITGDGIANFKGFKNIVKQQTGLNVIEFKNQFDSSNNKFQTSATGLVALAEVVQ